MKRIWLAALAVGLSGVALAQPMRQLSSQPLSPTDIQIPARKQAAPVPALLQTRAHEIYSTTCSGCHGITAQPGAKGPSLFADDFLSSHTDAQIVQAINDGVPGTAMPSFKTLLFPDEMAQMPAYLRIRGGIVNRHVGPVPDIDGKVFNTQKASFKAETLVKGLDQPWGMAFLPDGRMIFTERAGRLRFMDKTGKISDPVKGTPAVFVRQDGGIRCGAVARLCQDGLDLSVLFQRAAGLYA
jgi:mono/diheme cytochrome c family protein